MWQNMSYVLRNIWKWDKNLLFINIVHTPLRVINTIIGVYLSSYVVKMVTEGYEAGIIVKNITLISLCVLTMEIISNFFYGRTSTHALTVRMKYYKLLVEKSMETDFENIESAKGLNIFEKAKATLNGNNASGEASIRELFNFATNIFGLVSFGAILTYMHFAIVLIIIFTSITAYFTSKTCYKWDYKNRDNWIPIDRKINYLSWNMGDFKYAKDAKLYGMREWFNKLFIKTLSERRFWQKKAEKRWFLNDIINALLVFAREFSAFGFLIWLLFTKNLSPDIFVLYLGLIKGFSDRVSWVIYSYGELNRHSLNINDLRAAFDIPDRFNKGEGISLPEDTCDIEFKNVSFGYTPDKKVIKNLSLKINKGEKVAIVGANGAGKTTLIKLLCGFYMPSEGDIFVGGNNIKEYNIYEYFTLFSAVFQDINLLPVTISSNITCTIDNDIKGVNTVVELSGLKNKIDTLPDGIMSQMGKSIYDDAIELSGGETQKLALARALYKNGKILVLDEPTAALDPIAESKMYEQYNKMSGKKTSIFISHRLASAKFCDRIILIENGEIIESGTHDELVLLNGKYNQMYEIQSHYYKENILDKDSTPDKSSMKEEVIV